MKRTEWFRIGGGLAAFLLAAAAAAALNILAHPARARLDLTAGRIYTLSPGTRALLRELPADVKLKFFATKGESRAQGLVRDFVGRVKELLQQFERAAGGRVRVEQYDPQPDTDAEDLALDYGLERIQAGGEDEPFYLGVVAVCGDREQALPMLSPQSENLLEYNLARMIVTVSTPAPPALGVLSPLPVLGASDLPMMMPGQPPPPAWGAFQALRELFDVRELHAPLTSVDPAIEALILVQPGALDEATEYAVDQFLLRGGRLLVCVDPFFYIGGNDPMAAMMGGAPAGLDRLLKAWGVTLTPGRVVADTASGFDGEPLVLLLGARNLAESDLLTQGLNGLLMPFAGSLSVRPVPGIAPAVLARSTGEAGTISVMEAQQDAEQARYRSLKAGGAQTLAVRLQGRFPTAFPEGRPGVSTNTPLAAAAAPAVATHAVSVAASDSGAETNAVAAAAAPEPGLKESVRESAVVILADVDMLTDAAMFQTYNSIRGPVMMPRMDSDNLAFFLNAVDFLAGDKRLIGIRSRNRTERPLDRVRDLEQKSADRQAAEYQTLMARQEELNAKLADIQASTPEHQRAVRMNEEVEKARRELTREATRTARELRRINRERREDVERLGARVKALNILLPPTLVIGVGLTWVWMRRRR